MYITIGDTNFELSAKLKVAKNIEKKFKMSLTQVFTKIESAEVPELISILAIAADKMEDAEFANTILENWDYMDLQLAVQELLANLMFSGTDEQKEKKLAKFPAPEQGKNLIRELLGIPQKVPADSNGKKSSKQGT